MELLYTSVLILILLLSAALGWWVRRRLHTNHLAPETVDSIRLLMGMLLTFSALVLGLLTSNAKQRFDGLGDNLSAYAADLIELDQGLTLYGPETNAIRAQLRTYTAAAIADSWPHEIPPSGDYPRLRSAESGSIESRSLGQLLLQIDATIEHLTPTDPYHQQIATRLRNRGIALIEQRWRLVFASHATISWPFLLMLTTWLSIIFAIFGMTAPPSRTVYIVTALSALSIASPLYVIIDYSDALSGAIELPSAPMRSALAHMDTSTPQ
jgi:hypothetical protein